MVFHHIRRSVENGTRPAMEQQPTERDVLAAGIRAIRDRLPESWSLAQEKTVQGSDYTFVLSAPDGRVARLQLEAKALFHARDVPLVTRRLSKESPGARLIVLARYLSPRAREALTQAGFSYADMTGNLRVVVDDPAVFLAAQGKDRDPWRSADRPTNSLRGRPAARIVRALADMPPPWKMRELATAAGTSLGSTARTVDFLSREAFLVRDEIGTIIDVSWAAMLERWAADYELDRKRRVVRLIEPRDIARVERSLAESNLGYAISGSVAARRTPMHARSSHTRWTSTRSPNDSRSGRRTPSPTSS
jgi:hypothetical protein